MTRLYELTGQLKELEALSEGAEEDLAIAVRDTMGAIEAEFNEKALAVSKIVLNFDADVAALDLEIDRLSERKRVLQNRQNSIKEYLRENMEAASITKISCPLFVITLAKGRASVVIDHEKSIPDELMTVKTDINPNKTEIAKRIKAGEEVPGAHLEQGKSSVLIR